MKAYPAALLLALAVSLGAGCGSRSAPDAPAASTRPRSGAPAEEGTVTPAASRPSAEPSVAASASEEATAPAPQLVFRGDPSVRRVALTFDLCEVPSSPSGFDAELVDVLISRQIPATFFMGGHWAETHPEEAKLLGGITFFEIGNHSYAHRHPVKITPTAFDQEITRAQDAILQATGRTPRLFRFPYGENGPRRLKQVVDAGLVPVQWNVETGDPDPKVSANGILREVKRCTGNGAIVIMHANGRGRHTAEALPGVVDWLEAEGYELVTVSELLGAE